MAENAAQSIKELQDRLVFADKTLGEMIQRLGKYESWMSTIFSGIAKDAKVSIDEITDYLTKKMRRENLKQSESLMKDILGIEDAKKEVEKVPTMFERVIAQINQRAQQSGENFAKKLVNAESAKNEAEEFARTFLRSFQRAQQQIQQTKGNVVTAFSDVPQSLQPWINTVFKYMDTSRGHQALVNNPITRYAEALKQLQELERRYEGTDNALGRSYKNALIKVREYIEEVQKVKQLEEQAAQSQQKYASNVSAIEGVTRRYNDNEQALAKIQQRWEELNVKKQAGLINEKDFKTQTQQILDEYDRLIAKRKEFEIGDLGQMSSQRQNEREREEERLAQLRKSNTQARLDDEMRAERMIKQARAERAKKEAEADANMKKAVSQQVTSYKQLSALLKQYNSLKQVKGRTQEEEAALERTRQKIKEIIAEMRKLDSEQKGSLGKARDITEYDRILAKDREITNEKKKQNDLTKQQKANLDRILPTLQRLASAFGVAFSVRGLAQFGKKLIETRGEFELQQVALRSILQNKQLADEIWDKTMQAALQSPFTAMQLTKYTKQLAAYRIETDKLFDTTKRLADVSAGLGVDMQRLILAYGQVKAANYLRASEIRQFTEAGVNILGELSQYFTETREGMYDTAKVMDMVTKRMVKFEDVEAIFKRMTDQGGIFYEMQYVQSQTVKGQINKLRDAYDQMQNAIGKANEGVLKDMVSLLNSIVKNWRTWAVVLKSIAWGAVIGYLSKFALPLMGIGKASVATLRSIVRLRQGVQSLGASLKANLPMLGIFASTAVITALNNLRKKMNEVNKEIDEQNLRLYETRQNFEGMKSKIEENNRILKTAGSKTEDLNKAQKENESIMQRLRNEYPQLADQMQIATNGIIDMNDALDSNIRKLNEQMTVLNAMKQGNWFSDSDQKNLADWQGALATMKTTLIASQSEARKKMMQMELDGEEDSTLYELYKRVSEINLSQNIPQAVEDFEELDKEFKKLNIDLTDLNEMAGEFYAVTDLSSELGIKRSNLKANWSENRVKDVLDRLAPTLQSYYENGIKDNADFLKEINEQYGGNVTQFIQANAEKINQATLDGLNNANSILINTLKPQTAEMKTFLNQELNRLFGTTGIDYFSTSTKGTTPTNTDPEGDKQSKIDAAWRRRINLIEEMKKRYDELSKSAFGYAKSEKTVREAFDDSFAEIFKGTSIDISQIDFTSMSGMMDSMKVLLEKAKGVSDSVREELMKKIDSFEAQITIDAQVKIREDFGKEMEKMFSDYDLTLDLSKLSLPTDELQGIFDFDYTTLDMLRKKVDEFYNQQIALGDDPEKLVEQVEGYYKKIDEMEKKELRERLKTYTKYLEEGQNEALKIHLEELKKMAELDELYEKGYYTDTQYKDISKAIKKETDEKLAKNDWQQFKETDFYITMFEDLSKVSSESIDIMIKRLKALRKNIGDLDPKQAKEIVKTLEKLEKVKLERSPLKSFFADWRTASAWRKNSDNLVTKLTEYEGGVEYWKNKQEGQTEVVAGLRAEYEQLVQNGKLEDAAKVKEKLDVQEKSLSLINEQLENQENLLDQTNQEYNKGYAAQKRVYEGVARGAQYFNDIASAASTISLEILDMFDGVDDASKKLAKDIAEIATNTAALAGDIAKAIASEGSDVGSMIDGLVRTWNIIKGAFSVAETEINRTIEKNTEKLEDLETELERVKKARDKAWDVQAYRAAQKEIEYSIEQQIEAYDALISAEEDRKSSDKDQIRTWKKEREELFDQLEEEREQLLQDFGAIGESAYRSEAQGFVDAWKDAFLETGDGLSGLEDHFDEFLQSWFTKQATMRVAGRMLEPLFKQIDAAVDEYGQGGTSVTMQELADIRQKFGTIAPQLSDALEQIAGLWGVGESGSLSGLAAGIQGMTEEQANILEAYWNSVRGYTASIDMNVARIVDALGAGGVNTNPQLQQLSRIAASTQAVTLILQSVTKSGHSMGGQGIKVFLN